ncbi:MAG TPA: hypothetical protein VGM98_14345 [Schlesneria sp.]|jgi:hypothetical protein
MSKLSLLQTALTRGLAPEGDLCEELSELGEYEIASMADAEALTHAMAEFVKRTVDSDEAVSAFPEFVRLFQSVTLAEAYRHLAVKGIPLLIEAYDARLIDPSECESDLLFALKIFARYGTEEGLDRVVDAAYSVALQDGYLWAVIFEQLGDSDPVIPSFIRRLCSPLPDGFVCVAFLDWVNRLARDHVISMHPFNTPDGIGKLRSWLASSDEDEFSYAHAAASAVPFVTDPPRSELLALAMDHSDVGVQMEGAWASAVLGSDAGIKFLARLTLDRNLAITARTYLQELKRADAIPDEANEPEFVAMAELCDWLSHPQEFGLPPDEIELYDARELYWPPTNDWRPLWLFKYHYSAAGDDESVTDGIGMAGSITFSLIDETSVEMPPEDIYALHCCWELEANDDPRAPAERSIEAGRAVIDAAQRDDIEDDEKF